VNIEMNPHVLSAGKALLTGASGFIGSALARRLIDIGVNVVGTARNKRESLAEEVSWYFGDLANAAFVQQVFAAERPDVVFHLASFASSNRSRDVVLEAFHSNLASTVNLLVAADAMGCQRVILTGSFEEPEPGNLSAPVSPYAAAKCAAASYAQMFHALYHTPVVTARLFMVYGPGRQDMGKLIPYVIRSFHMKCPPELSSGVRQVDWIFVDDVVSAFLHLATAKSVEGRTFDVGSGRLVTIRDVVEEIQSLMKPVVVPRWGALPDRPLERVRVANIGLTERHTGWHPKSSLREGLQKTIDWVAMGAGRRPARP
jgi:nucleoside-diphosphate-sugar epimerase